MLGTQGERPVHIPANPDVFQFDAEVSAIFPDMAKRAIPMYHEAHRAHIGMLRHFLGYGNRSILDVGASRGAFFQHLKEAFGYRIAAKEIELTAVDNSIHMCQYLAKDYPEARVYMDDIGQPGDLNSYWRHRTFDVVVLYYVLQFVPPQQQVAALQQVLNRVAPGGYFLFGHKEALSGDGGALAQAEYIRFRLRNGYTQEEIDAKSTALKGSMFQLSNEAVLGMVRTAGFEIQPTTRWMAFNTFLAKKK